jgi:hypothetical protein
MPLEEYAERHFRVVRLACEDTLDEFLVRQTPNRPDHK